MYSPLTEIKDIVKVVELLVGARLLTIIEAVLTVPTQEMCKFPFSAQIEGLTLYQPDVEDINGFDSLYSQPTPMIIR